MPMRHLTATLCLLLLAAVALPAQAQVAQLDWRRALMETQAARASMDELEGRVGSQQRQAESLGEELQRMQQRLQQEGESMAEAERQEAVQAFQRKGAEFEQLRGQVMQARQQAEQEFLERAEPYLEDAVDEVVQRHGVEVLVEPQGVLHSDTELPDLTGEVTQILDSQL